MPAPDVCTVAVVDRRSTSASPPDGVDRRRGDRRRGQAAVLDHRRVTDRRLDAAGLDVVLQQQAFRRRAAVPARIVDLVQRTVDLREPTGEPSERAGDPRRPEPEVRLDPCPLCGALFDRLWLFRHVAVDH